MAMRWPRWVPLVLAVALSSGCATASNKPGSPAAEDLVATERLADAAYQAGRSEEAAELYLRMVEEMPEQAEYWYRLANSLVRTARYDEAVVAYRRALALEPDNSRAWHNLGIVSLRQAQAAFASSVKHSRAGEPVFEESLRLSTAVYSLTGPGQAPAGEAGPDADASAGAAASSGSAAK